MHYRKVQRPNSWEKRITSQPSPSYLGPPSSRPISLCIRLWDCLIVVLILTKMPTPMKTHPVKGKLSTRHPVSLIPASALSPSFPREPVLAILLAFLNCFNILLPASVKDQPPSPISFFYYCLINRDSLSL